MKKSFRIDGDICANCAAKIQDKIVKLDGVNSASVNAMTLKFTLDADDAVFEKAKGESIKIFAKMNPTAKSWPNAHDQKAKTPFGPDPRGSSFVPCRGTAAA